jgi:hypothetical protein
MNRVGHILRREQDEEIDDILKKVIVIIDYNAWTAPNLVYAFAQADRLNMKIIISAARYASLDTMYFRVKNLVHEVRHLTAINEAIPHSSDWGLSDRERDAIGYSSNIMDKYLSDYVR